MALTPLIELTRGDTVECQHLGVIAVVDSKGTLRASAGNPDWLTFPRSTLKAFQALPLLEAGGHRDFGYSSEHIAMLCASHNGEAIHVARVDEMLKKVGASYTALECGCHVPALYSYFDTAPPPGLAYDERHNNCSGKHAGFLAYCVQHGQPMANYVAIDHPLQQAIRRDVARVVGMSPDALKVGIDGCSAPNFAMPVSKIAYGYARLASGIHDTEFGASFESLSNAMIAHPELVSGSRRNDLAFMRAGRGDWISKVGADGVQAIGSKSRREGFAIKIIDGNKAALFAASIEVLDQLGWLDGTQRAELAPWRAATITNARGLHVGTRRPAFTLQAAK